jgi:hypothetical protein
VLCNVKKKKINMLQFVYVNLIYYFMMYKLIKWWGVGLYVIKI